MSLFDTLRSLFEQRSVDNFKADYTGTDALFSDQQGLSIRRIAGYPPVSQALQMVSGDCAKIPVAVFQTGPDGRLKQPWHAILNLIGLWGAPNEIDTTFDLLHDWFFQCLLFGRSAIYIERVGPDPVGLIPLLPDRTTPVYYQGKRYFATEVRGDGSPTIEYLPDADVLYLEYLSITGLGPTHPISLYRETFEQAINAQDFTSNYFKGGTQQGGILMIPPGASPKAIDNVESQIESKRADRSKWFKSLVLKDGFRWQSTTSSLKDATAVELDESTARQIARCYNIPPSQLGLQDSVSYNSLFADKQRYLDSCLATWLIQARSQFHRKLLLPSEQATLQVDYEIDQLQWADPETKAKIGMMGRQWGFLDVNTVRKWFDERPLTPEELKSVQNQGSSNVTG